MCYRYCLLIIGLICTVWQNAPSFAQSPLYTIDDFESGTLKGRAAWTVSGPAAITVVKPPRVSQDRPGVVSRTGKYVLGITGIVQQGEKAFVWAPLEQDGSNYSHVRLMLFCGAGSEATIELSFLDDDDRDRNMLFDNDGAVRYDDCFSYPIAVNWTGWKTIVIPLDAFRDTNPGTGDDVWNPNKTGGSAGIAAICVTGRNKKTGPVNIALDTIELLKVELF